MALRKCEEASHTTSHFVTLSRAALGKGALLGRNALEKRERIKVSSNGE